MERREYERISVAAKGTFFVSQGGKIVSEFIGDIVDISENGIRVEVVDAKNNSCLEKIEENCTISFQAMEEFEFFGSQKFQFFNGEIEIVHKIVKDNVTILGCRLPSLSSSAKQYVEDRKVSIFISSMKK